MNTASVVPKVWSFCTMLCNDAADVIGNTTHEIVGNRRSPLYVAEGYSISKIKIKSIEYLRHSYPKLQENTAGFFALRCSAVANDAHVNHAILSSKVKHVYFGVFGQIYENVTALDAELGRYKKLGGDVVPYSFFDPETAHVWDGPPDE